MKINIIIIYKAHNFTNKNAINGAVHTNKKKIHRFVIHAAFKKP